MIDIPAQQTPQSLSVELVAISGLRQDQANARQHGTKNLDAIKTSLLRFGQQKPIVVGLDGTIIAGNGTYEAAKMLGWDQVAIIRTGLRGEEARAYAIADNRTGELSEWNVDALIAQLESMPESMLETTGFDAAELAAIRDVQQEPIDFGEAPPNVQRNIEKLAEIRAMRKRGDENMEGRSDTEYYLVVVFRSRGDKQQLLERLGLPDDERYVAADGLRIERTFAFRPVSEKQPEKKAAKRSKAGTSG